MNSKIELKFLPENRTVYCKQGEILLRAVLEAAIEIEMPCNGKGRCGKCRVLHVEGEVSEPQPDELKHLGIDEISRGVRLACQTNIMGDATFKMAHDFKRKHRILSTGFMPEFELNPNISKKYIELPTPSVSDSAPDLELIERELGKRIGDSLLPHVVRKIPDILRRSEFKITLIFSGDRLIGIEEGDTTGEMFGVAVDIGTTTVIASLVDLNTGAEVRTASTMNPQKDYGHDVLTRIKYVGEHLRGLERLGTLIRGEISRLIDDLCARAEIEQERIYEVAVAANSTMMHLFLGVDPSSLGRSPYIPAFTSSQTVPASELNLRISDSGEVYCLPSVSGYIGGDIVAGLLTSELYKSHERALFIDIGTNGEIVLGSKEDMHACSCAAGPALEGMNISCGMIAADGAIEKVYIDGDVKINTIGDRPAIGICGSGIIDAVSELLKAGAIESSGRFIGPTGKKGSVPSWASRLRSFNNNKSFVLAHSFSGNEIRITQKDVRQVQLAKGAILSGITALSRRLGITFRDLDVVYIAGAFGHHIRMESLAGLGVIPEECLSKVKLIGNSSKAGAVLCLLSRQKRQEASWVSKRVSCIDLSCYSGYEQLFTESLSFYPSTLKRR